MLNAIRQLGTGARVATSVTTSSLPLLIIGGLLYAAFFVKAEPEIGTLKARPLERRDAFYGVVAPGGSILWAAGSYGKIVRSDDGGKSWEVQASPVVAHLQSIAAWDARRAVAVGNRGLAVVTDDGGKTWKEGVLSEFRKGRSSGRPFCFWAIRLLPRWGSCHGVTEGEGRAPWLRHAPSTPSGSPSPSGAVAIRVVVRWLRCLGALVSSGRTFQALQAAACGVWLGVEAESGPGQTGLRVAQRRRLKAMAAIITWPEAFARPM
ncbi:MAG TPA: hypothetical protein PLM62_20540 [Zoogloea sp.]|nr:hypothetical protein [Zoogloea sp.]